MNQLMQTCAVPTKKNCVDATPFVRFCKPWVHGVQPFEDTIRLFVVDAVVLV